MAAVRLQLVSIIIIIIINIIGVGQVMQNGSDGLLFLFVLNVELLLTNYITGVLSQFCLSYHYKVLCMTGEVYS